MFCNSPSFLADKKVSSKELNHFTIALAENNVDREDASLCFKDYNDLVTDLSGINSKSSLEADNIKR